MDLVAVEAELHRDRVSGLHLVEDAAHVDQLDEAGK
jgi:hypothetical protein